MVHDALTNDAARTRASTAKIVDALLAAPTNPHDAGANALWQLAVLEMWLQSMEH